MTYADFKIFVNGYGVTLHTTFQGDGSIEPAKGGAKGNHVIYFADLKAGAILPDNDYPIYSNESPELKARVKEVLDNSNEQIIKQVEKNTLLPIKDKGPYLPKTADTECLVFKDTINVAGGRVKVLNTADNLQSLGKYYGMTFRFNLMTFEIDICDLEGGSLATNVDEIRSQLISLASVHQLPKATIDDHLSAVCQRNKYHPIKDYLDNGEWDGIKRVEAVIDCVNAKHRKIAQIVLKRWLVGVVACLYEDYFKSKLVPVLQGDQSFKKTAFVERIAQLISAAFLEGAELNPDNKDSVLSCIRHWIVELGELERTSKNSQGSLKAFISKSVDTVRPPYGRGDIKKMRQTAFIATVNGSEFLKDETGSSRFGVIEMERAADMDKLNHLLGWDYDGTGSIKQPHPELLRQFWLEVKHLYQQGEKWQLDEAEVQALREINSNFNDNGPWYELILDGHINSDCIFFDKWVAAGDFVKEKDNCTGKDTSMIGKALRRLAADGYLESKKGSGNRTLYRAISKGQLDL